MLHLVPPDGVCLPACGYVVDAVAVGSGDDGGIVGGLGPSLDFDAVNARFYQILQMVNGAHIPGIENVSALFVLENREVFSGSLFLHQGVLIPAGLGAGSPVGVPAGHVVAEQTPTGIADAHRPVAEGLDFQFWIHLLPDGANFVQRAFSGQHHPRCPQVKPALGAFVVGDGLLGGNVTLTVGRVFSRQHESP